MVFDIDEIPEEGLDFEVLESKDQFEISQPDCSICQDVGVRGTLNKIERDVYFTGRVNTGLKVLCSRCLEPFRFQVDSKVTARFVPKNNAGKKPVELELHAGDIDVDYYEGHMVDITQPVRDQIVLSLPAVCLCKEDCLGLCLNCGENKNRGNCACKAEPETDPRLEVLKTLKDKLK
ncbi:MAG: DUF177 domain-containing protein [Nitrospinaceae bacterium]